MRIIPLLCAVSLLAWAQDRPMVHFVRASGEATVTAKPDRAELSIGVMTRAATAQAASAQNASESGQVLDAVKRTLGEAGEIKTSGYSISPQYQYGNNQPPKVTGYEADNTVSVTIDDLSRVGKIIDAAMGAGANNIQGISFTLRDDAAVRTRALSEAAVHARANAEALAKALNLKVGNVLEVEPSELPVLRPRPIPMEAMAMKAAPQTTVEPGTLDFHASVTVKLEIQ